MYFDFDYYFKVLRHTWGLKDWPLRNKTLFKLLVLVPLESTFHAIFFLLDYVFFPSLWTQQVNKPIFILGHARSGTTMAHRLLSADGDKFNDFLYWEMFFPSLLQKKIIRFLGKIDQKVFGGPIKRRLVALDDKLFGPYRHIHYMSFWNAEEDQFSMRSAFVTQQWATDMPLMDVIDMFHVDQMPEKKRRWMKHYKEIVKRQLLLNGGQAIHLSKNPVMCGWTESIIETFPDAKIIVMVRNPLECIPSLLKLMEVNWQGKGWQYEDYKVSLEALTLTCFESFTNPKAVLERYPNVPAVAVDYRKLTTEPRQTVHDIYKALGMEVSETFDNYLIETEQREKSHKTHFTYSIEDYENLSHARIENELDEFFTEYNWPRPSEQPQTEETPKDQAASE